MEKNVSYIAKTAGAFALCWASSTVPMLVSGCESESPLPDAISPDAPIDAAVAPDVTALDAGRDAPQMIDAYVPDGFSPPDAFMPPDAFIPPDAFMPPDAFAPDAFVPPDAGFDCTTCRAALPCETLRCVTSCEYTPSVNGTSCGGDDSVCVAASCVMRRCGDGWRETGSSSSPVEGCDDGNTTAGDGCDAMCDAEPLLVHSSPMRSIRASWGRPASAVDDLGNTLVTWSEFDFSNYYIMARRYDRNGAPIDAAPVMMGVSPSTNEALPIAQGLPSGWVMSWPEWMLDESGQGIAYSMVPVTGAIPAPRLANDGDGDFNQNAPSIARLSTGFVIAWSSNRVPRQNIAIRYFNMNGTPRGPLTNPRPVDMAVLESDAIATSRGGDAWTLTYLEGFADTTVKAIDYVGTTAGAPYTIRFGQGAFTAFARGDTGTAMALVQDGREGRVLIRHLADGMRPTDDTDFMVFGDGQLDDHLGLASLGGSAWLAVWSRSSLSTGERFAAQLSAGATVPRGLDRMLTQLRGPAIPSDFSIGRVSANLIDGWIVTYTAGNRIYTMRLTPG